MLTHLLAFAAALPNTTQQDGPWGDDERDVRGTWRSDRERDEW